MLLLNRVRKECKGKIGEDGKILFEIIFEYWNELF